MVYNGCLNRGLATILGRQCVAQSLLRFSTAQSTRNFTKTPRPLHGDLVKFMHGRGNRERRDSVTNEILWERQQHMKRLGRLPANQALVRALEDEGLGSRRRKHQVYSHITVHEPGVIKKKTNSGAGGFALHLTSTSRDWPIFKHLLPEIAFAGHSNSGKSTLVNAMIGVLPSKGPAKVSERAGWTDQICFYQLGKKPPVMTLADLPGYGHAVASAGQRRAWGEMIRDYLQNRTILSRCCILVDSTRGLCKGDKMLVRFLTKYDIPWMVVLTKGDLLDCTSLAQCVLAVQLDLAPFVRPPQKAPQQAQKPLSRGEKGGAREAADQVGGPALTDASSEEQEDNANNAKDSQEYDDDVASIVTQFDEEEMEEMRRNEEAGLADRVMWETAVGESTTGDVQLSQQENLSESDSDYNDWDGESDEEEEENESDSDSYSEADSDTSDGSESEGESEGENEDDAPESDLARIAAEEAADEVYVPESLDVPNKHLVPVHVISSSTGAGIPGLWKRLCGIVREDSVLPKGSADVSHIVREHRLAMSLRRKHAVQKADAQRSGRGRSRNPDDTRPRDAHKRPILVSTNRRRIRDRLKQVVKEGGLKPTKVEDNWN